MRAFILAMAIGALVVVGFVEWNSAMPLVRGASVSTSQIYIHGTPVCVLKQGETIVARIGRCEGPGDSPDAESPGDPSIEDGPGGTDQLPPGHPPIPDGALPEGQRRIPI